MICTMLCRTTKSVQHWPSVIPNEKYPNRKYRGLAIFYIDVCCVIILLKRKVLSLDFRIETLSPSTIQFKVKDCSEIIHFWDNITPIKASNNQLLKTFICTK